MCTGVITTFKNGLVTYQTMLHPINKTNTTRYKRSGKYQHNYNRKSQCNTVTNKQTD